MGNHVYVLINPQGSGTRNTSVSNELSVTEVKGESKISKGSPTDQNTMALGVNRVSPKKIMHACIG